MTVVGFTGTATGMTAVQHAAVTAVLDDLFDGDFYREAVFHHGVCIHADAEAHWIVRSLRPLTHIVGHPGLNSRREPAARDRKAERDCDELWREVPYLARNCDIVGACDVLVAAPSGPERRRGSGTWATIRRAGTVGRRCILVWPNGDVEERKNHEFAGNSGSAPDEIPPAPASGAVS